MKLLLLLSIISVSFNFKILASCEYSDSILTDGFISENIEQLDDSRSCNQVFKFERYYSKISNVSKNEFCECVDKVNDTKTLSSVALSSVVSPNEIDKSKDLIRANLLKKQASSLRNQILNTLSRSFKFDKVTAILHLYKSGIMFGNVTLV